MTFIPAQNTLNTFLTFKHLFHVQGVRFPCQTCQAARRKFHDVNLVLTSMSLRRKILPRKIDSYFSSVKMIIN